MSISISEVRTTENLFPNAIKKRIPQQDPFAIIVSADGELENISYGDLENASNRAAWFLDENCPNDETFFYMGPSDLRFMIWGLACMKTGKCVMFPSPGNAVPANRKLFVTVGAKKFLYAPEFAPPTQPLRAATEDLVDAIVTPSYTELMAKEQAPLYPFEKTWDEVKRTRFMGAHTSGTSGHPKPIYWTHEAVSVVLAFLDDSFVGANGTNLSRELIVGQRMLLPFPLFHMGGMASVMGSVFGENILVLPKSGTALSPPNFTAMLEHAKCTTAFAPPAVLEALLKYPPGLEALSRLEHVAYTGGPLHPERGAELAKHIKHLFPILGSTEGGAAVLESTGDSSRWNAFKFVDVGQRMEEDAPGFYELVFPRNERVNQAYGYFHVYPHLKKEYRTSDLMSPADDTENGWWVYRGRADNWVAMSNGLKMDPTDMENLVATHPKVKGVLVAGSHRFRLCMLIELNEENQDEDEAKVIEEIWPLVEQANKDSPKFGRVPKELIMVAKHDKPFLRAAKGTVQRQLTVVAYQEEIDQLYERVENGLLTSGLPPISSTRAEELQPFLTTLIQGTLDLGDKAINLDDDLVQLGVDSLSAFVLLARLKAALRENGAQEKQLESINPKFLYSATTVRKMAEGLSAWFDDATANNTAKETRDFENLVEKYTAEVTALAEKTQPLQNGDASAANDGKVVLLTGSTGSLGSYILSSLLADSTVKGIVCLNRDTAKKARSRQAASFESRGLSPLPEANNGRLSFLQADLSAQNLGLSAEEYAALSKRVTCVIHNAFPVNWLLDIASFEPQLRGLLQLLEFAASAAKQPQFMFMSSIAAASPIGDASSSAGEIPEKVLSPQQAPKLLLQQGYARAKYICERLLEVYSASPKTSKTKIDVLRIAQICGPTQTGGAWNPSEWLPSLVISSARFVGAVPETLGAMDNKIDWVPVDLLGRIVGELASSSESQSNAGKNFTVYNVVNPQPTSWSKLLPALEQIVPRRISPTEWIANVEGKGKDGGDKAGDSNQLQNVHRNPALKLVDFYKQALPSGNGEGEQNAHNVVSDNLLRASETAKSLVAITEENMSQWLEYWNL